MVGVRRHMAERTLRLGQNDGMGAGRVPCMVRLSWQVQGIQSGENRRHALPARPEV